MMAQTPNQLRDPALPLPLTVHTVEPYETMQWMLVRFHGSVNTTPGHLVSHLLST